jgi:hypothetical protein
VDNEMVVNQRQFMKEMICNRRNDSARLGDRFNTKSVVNIFIPQLLTKAGSDFSKQITGHNLLSIFFIIDILRLVFGFFRVSSVIYFRF